MFICFLLTKSGLCVTLAVEVMLIRFSADDDITKPFGIVSKVLLLRSLFLAAAAAQILHAVFAFKYGDHHNLLLNCTSRCGYLTAHFFCCRDYEVLNHQLLRTLVEKVRAIEDNNAGELLVQNSDEIAFSFHQSLCRQLLFEF
jgi:hypothetical protein